MSKVITIRTTISPEMDGYLEQIRVINGFNTRSEVVRVALAEYKKKQLDNYIALQQARDKRKKADPNQIAIDQARNKLRNKERDKANLTPFKEICEKLGGSVIGEGDKEVCAYPLFEEMAGSIVSQTERQIPLELLTDESIETQYKDIFGNTGKEAKAKIKSLI